MDEIKNALVGRNLYLVCYKKNTYIIIANDFVIGTVDKETVLIFSKARRVLTKFNKATLDFDTDIQEEVHLLMWRMVDVTLMYQIL